MKIEADSLRKRLIIKRLIRKSKDPFGYINANNIDLSGVEVEEAIFKWVDFTHTNLSNTKFEKVLFIGCRFKDANLHGAEFRGVTAVGGNFDWVDMSDMSITNGDFRECEFTYADWTNMKSWATNFVGICCTNTKIKESEFRLCNFQSADLSDAILDKPEWGVSNLYNVNFGKNRTENEIGYISDAVCGSSACPIEGSFIGWKKIFDDEANEYRLVKLWIPEDAKRSSSTTQKCRCSFAQVLKITDLLETTEYDKVENWNYKKTLYKVGEMVFPDSFDEDRWTECSHGIHFFIDKRSALNY